MKFSTTEPGFIVSGALHVGLLLATLVVFSDNRKFEEAQESVPVEVITDEQFNQVIKGDKTAKEKKPLPPVASKIADVSETKPIQDVAEGKTDILAPPPPLKKLPDPGDDKPVEPPKPEAQTPPKPPEAKPEVKPEPPKEAEPVEPPKPQPRPKEEPKKPEVAPPLPPQRPKPPEQKPATKPKSGEETTNKPKYDSSAIAQLLSKETPQQKAVTGREVNRTASLGATNANAAKMSPSLFAQLDGLIVDQYKQCWAYFGTSGKAYLPQIRVAYTQDWRLVADPELLNPPSDPAYRSLAESALRAVKKCNPLHIPPQFAPYYDQWKSRILRFDPDEMAG